MFCDTIPSRSQTALLRRQHRRPPGVCLFLPLPSARRLWRHDRHGPYRRPTHTKHQTPHHTHHRWRTVTADRPGCGWQLPEAGGLVIWTTGPPGLVWSGPLPGDAGGNAKGVAMAPVAHRWPCGTVASWGNHGNFEGGQHATFFGRCWGGALTAADVSLVLPPHHRPCRVGCNYVCRAAYGEIWETTMAQRLDWGGLWIPPIAWLQFWACCPQPRRLLGFSHQSVSRRSVSSRGPADVWFLRLVWPGIAARDQGIERDQGEAILGAGQDDAQRPSARLSALCGGPQVLNQEISAGERAAPHGAAPRRLPSPP